MIRDFIITHENITNDFLLKLPFTEYEGLKHSILCAFPEVKYLDPHSIKRPLRPKFLEILLKDKKGSRRIYDCLMSQIHHKPLCQKKWSKDLSLPDDYNWREIFKILNLLQKIPRYSGSNIGLHIES